MEHVVFFPGPDGSPAFRRTTSLEDAVRFVEHLRNTEGVAEVSVHALSEVPLAFRAYYRVEMPTAAYAPVEVPVQQQEPVVVEARAVELQPAEPVDADVVVEAAVPEQPALAPAAAPAEEPVAGAVAQWPEAPAPEGQPATPFVTPEPIQAYGLGDVAPGAAADVVPSSGEQPGVNGHRSLGFFAR